MPDIDSPKNITITETIGSGTSDPQSYCQTKAQALANETGNIVTFVGKVWRNVNFVSYTATATPPARDSDISKKASGTPAPTPPSPNSRTSASASSAAESSTGSHNPGDELDNSASPGMPKDQAVRVLNGARRKLGGVIPSMEAVMMNVPQNSLAKFTSLLPPAFKSLLPLGAVAGLVSKGSVSMGSLTNLVAGAALGAVAGQALRSLSGGPRAVSGLSGALGAQAIARVSGSSAIPINISSTFGRSLLSNQTLSASGRARMGTMFSNTPSTAAVISNVVAVVTNVALNRGSGVPVSSQILGLAANVALRSSGVPTGVPTNILGLASSSAMNPLAALIGSSVSGRVPVLPGNLSLPNIGALSGLTQNISPGLAENLIPPNQIVSLLPGNLQAQIPAIPPRVNGGSPYIQNNIGARREASIDTTGPVEPNTKATSQDAMVKGAGGANVDYSMKISSNYTLGDFCLSTPITPNRYLRAYAAEGLSVDQLIENLSWLAVNLIEPIRSQFPGFTLNGGFDFPGAVPGSKRVAKSKHFLGSAMDLQWRSDMTNFPANKARAEWIARNLPIRGCILEAAGKGMWIHVDGRKIKEPVYIATHRFWNEIARNEYVNPL